MPEDLVWEAVQDAVGRKRDGLLRTSPVRYFIGRMKREAREREIDLGFQSGGEPEPAEPRSDVPQVSFPQLAEIGTVGKGQTDSSLNPQVKLKVDAYIVTLPQREQDVLREKAREQLSDDASDQGVYDQMRQIVAAQMRVGGDGRPQ